MTSLPSPEFPHSSNERDTESRSSLVNGVIERDWWTNHPAGRHRLVMYPEGTPEQQAYRSRLRSAGLILGKMISSSEGKAVYRIPRSARKITYDASSYATGAFTYGDDELFYDIGSLLANVSAACGPNKVIQAPVEDSFAIVEFTRPSERQLYFAPGVERWVVDNPTEGPVIGYYAEALSEQFAGRFANAAFNFRMGYENLV